MSDTMTLQEAADRFAVFSDPDTLAEYFRAEGIKGKPIHANSCPVSVALSRATGGSGRIATFPGTAYQVVQGMAPVRAALPPVADAFIRRFDQLQYPDLIEVVA